MPRASGSSKRQSGAAHRDTKENGLVAPAKRVTGRKSLNPPEGPARPADHGAGHAGPQFVLPNGVSKAAIDFHDRSTDARRASVGNYSETSTSESCTSHIGSGSAANVDGGHRQIDVNALKNADVHRDSGPIDMVATVLKTLPMQDTLAILIILMQLPTLSLSIIYGIFTCLTFVPPVTTSSGINLNFAEIFDGHSTMPSLVTVVCMDFFFLLVWLFLWQPVQDAILDLAKPIIAITLGGGTTYRNGGSRGLTTCFIWIVINHVIRSTRTHWSRLARHIPEDWQVPSALSSTFESTSVMHDKRSAFAWVRSGLAIHILTQGLVRYIREWYLRREKANAASGQHDPEAGKPVATISINGEIAHDTGFNTPDTETGCPPQPAAPASTNKKRRKQSTQVRLQQPLWAALASTKIVVMKEYESSHVPSKSLGVNTTDIHNLGNAPFNTQPKQIWISYIGSDEVCFNTSHFPDLDDEPPLPTTANGHAITRPAGVDTSKPFYVKVNNAFWQPTRIFPVVEADDGGRGGTRWTGDIYGLRPSSKYVCEFVDIRTDKVVFSTSIRTIKEPARENSNVPVAVSGSQQSLQPDSPATTLSISIAAAEVRLNDEKNRLKTWRKEWKSRINALKKENELTDNQLASAGHSDDKYRQKIRQQETQKAQAERDTETQAEQLKKFDGSPELAENKKKMERSYSGEKKLYDAAQKSFREYKATLESEVQSKDNEKGNLNTKRNKIATRIAKVENELANITDANNRGLNEVERRKRERAGWQEQIVNSDKSFNDQLGQSYANNNMKAEHLRSLQNELQTVRSYMSQANGLPVDMASLESAVHVPFHSPQPQQQQLPPQQQPQTPWNPNPAAPAHFPASVNYWGGVNGENHSSTSLSLGPPGLAAWQSPPMTSFELRGAKSRGRSSSMLSDVSGFTQPSDEEPRSPVGMGISRRPMYTKRFGMHDSRRSTGSGGSGGSGSMGDPSSPA
ncbi:hypothetical protein N5P37_006925 [Trichoderma harzianum]|uniref:Ubiquitination network signaling protein n=1 Tax=Trichoderma harzianum CBS 226.95 TaxID=983964 RepID=A0A2T4A2C1_TRIHA|nr:hypothetical protein M431DRAFT_93792 [Trichoderma harzianum CBS 226.95]KAK0760727.1 hypothetical protein N5P37_006925 [Trichoderma harzianum]PKK49363.1 hypothetical protein CI102_5997 [Trichoderma harzianum]PTB51215.1 hypothetical protein M431DRAFT_93792 [Trichoderma harzianum CBS 226.95]